MGFPISLDLPTPRTEPLDRSTGAFAKLSTRERRLAEALLGDAAALCLVRTGTRVDVGRWFLPGRVWAVALPGELALFASGRRPYGERIPFANLRASVYNPVIGALVLAPAEGARVRRLRMAPLDGYQMLAQIHAAGRGGSQGGKHPCCSS